MSSRTSLEYFLGRDLALQHALQLTIGFRFGILLVQNHERKLNYYGEKELNSFFMMEKVEKIFQSIIRMMFFQNVFECLICIRYELDSRKACKKLSISLVKREMQIKSTIVSQPIPTEMGKTKENNSSNNKENISHSVTRLARLRNN